MAGLLDFIQDAGGGVSVIGAERAVPDLERLHAYGDGVGAELVSLRVSDRESLYLVADLILASSPYMRKARRIQCYSRLSRNQARNLVGRIRLGFQVPSLSSGKYVEGGRHVRLKLASLHLYDLVWLDGCALCKLDIGGRGRVHGHLKAGPGFVDVADQTRAYLASARGNVRDDEVPLVVGDSGHGCAHDPDVDATEFRPRLGVGYDTGDYTGSAGHRDERHHREQDHQPQHNQYPDKC